MRERRAGWRMLGSGLVTAFTVLAATGCATHTQRMAEDEFLAKIRPRLEAGAIDEVEALLQKEVESLPEGSRRRASLVRILRPLRLTREFARLRLDLHGVVGSGGTVGVLINGEVYEAGEYLDPTLFVKAVRREEIEFVYKGFTFVKTL